MVFVCSLYVQRITYRYALIKTADLSECVRPRPSRLACAMLNIRPCMIDLESSRTRPRCTSTLSDFEDRSLLADCTSMLESQVSGSR